MKSEGAVERKAMTSRHGWRRQESEGRPRREEQDVPTVGAESCPRSHPPDAGYDIPRTSKPPSRYQEAAGDADRPLSSVLRSDARGRGCSNARGYSTPTSRTTRPSTLGCRGSI